MKGNKEKKLHKLFRLGIIFKGTFAFLQLLGGFLVVLISNETITSFAQIVAGDEISEDPKDAIANYIIRSVNYLSVSTQHFIAIYLLVHGAVKLILVAGLFKNKTWAYPASLFVFGAFIFYQVERMFVYPSWWLLGLTIVDIFIIWLIWHEYRQQLSLQNTKPLL